MSVPAMSFPTMSAEWDEVSPTEAIVKWFNSTKGFGFVAPLDGSSDAFIHSSIVARAGLHDVVEGTKMLVRVGAGAKGRQVLDIVEVMGIEDVRSVNTRPPLTGSEMEISGVVKWFKPEKGFGFVMPDDQGPDIFVHRSVVLRAGLQTLEVGQKIKMLVQTTAKGREAALINMIGQDNPQ